MSIASKGLSAIGKLAAVGLLLVAFLFGLAGVVYMSLQGSEVAVPDITGKNFLDSEKELALLGLKIKKRADRPSTEAPNTVIEQLPKPGDTVKTGQMILVVTSKPAEGDETPTSLKKGDEDDTDKIEEMITDKPKKPKANSNSAKKKADTSRDVNSNSNSNSNSSDPASNKKEPGNSNSGDKPNQNKQTPPGTKPATTTTTKPGADSRPRQIRPN